MHPSSGLDKEYAVRVKPELEDESIEILKQGITIDGHLHRFTDIRYYDGRSSNHWYHVVLMEGRNREVHKLFESQDAMVSRLKRVRYGPVVLPSWLKRGRVVELDPMDVRAVCALMGIEMTPVKATNQTAKDKSRSVLLPYPGLRLP